ncbi:MAG: GNAT family N-acetyltransferase [Burkholderiales bacterium]
MNILGPKLDAAPQCEAVLRRLPSWFGIEEALRMYARDSALLPGFAIADDDARIVGFISLTQHFTASWEVHCIAVLADARHQGHGRTLLAHAERWLVDQGARWLQVKTITAASDSASYAQTRAFYERLGFDSLEVFPELWSPRHPCLQMIKALR